MRAAWAPLLLLCGGARGAEPTAEELVADFEPDYAPVGLLNDDTTAVGSVHVGFVYVADAGGRPVAIRETEKLEGRFATTEEVSAVRDGLETWSRLVFDALTEPGG